MGANLFVVNQVSHPRKKKKKSGEKQKAVKVIRNQRKIIINI